MLRPVIDWFILNGIISKPKNNRYEIGWEVPDISSGLDRADIAVKKSQALSNYVNTMGADKLITEKQFVEEILGEEYREDDLPDSDDFDTEEDIESAGQDLDDESNGEN